MGARTPLFWYDRQIAVPLWARLLEPVYVQAVAARRWLFRKGLIRTQRIPVPVVVVGNITAGGTGKTPMTIALIEQLQSAGWSPGVASRGYGRAQPKVARWVDVHTPAPLGGDEPVLIARKTGVPVRVDRDRVAAANALVAEGCDIVVCDDGLQHYRLGRDLELEVVDAQRGYGNGRMIPAGPLREPRDRGAHCSFRVLNMGSSRSSQVQVGAGQWPMRLGLQRAEPLMRGLPLPLSAFSGKRVHAVAGIAHPERFFEMLRSHGIAVVPHAFPDHHNFVAEDLQFSSELPVLMTEKDAVKCVAFARSNQFAVPLEAQLPPAFWGALLHQADSLKKA